MLPDQLVLDQAVGAHEIGSDGAILDEAHHPGVSLLPVGMGAALRLVDLHHGGVECLKVEQAEIALHKVMTIDRKIERPGAIIQYGRTKASNTFSLRLI